MKKIAFSWYGGKTSHLGWLLPIVEGISHQTYVESFGGSGAVLINKKQSPVEVYNDIYGEVVHFFRVLRERGSEVIASLQLTPYSREEFASACLDPLPTDSDVERACKFFIRARQVRTGLATTASEGKWSYTLRDSRRGMALTCSRWLGAIAGLDGLVERLRTIQIENKDAFDVIERYDTPGTLHYIDPPYPLSSRTGGVGYAHELTDNQHKNLLDLLLRLEGKVVLSSYSNPLYDGCLGQWRKVVAPAKRAASTRQDGKQQLRQEVVYIKEN